MRDALFALLDVVTPERWYMAFWVGAWLVSVPPVVVLLYLILRKL